MRVLLEANAPLEKVEFFEGPVYVMMCYNLHGSFSGPGEKSNQSFIKELILRMEKIPGRKNFAIPTGGFEWKANGEAYQINEKEAEKKIEEFKGTKIRDEKTGYLIGKYKDEEGLESEIWYSDKETLRRLSEPIIEKGYDISIWRLSEG